MNSYLPFLFAFAVKDKAPGLAETMMFTSSAVPPAPRLMLAYTREKQHSDELKARDQRDQAAAQQIQALVAALAGGKAKLPKADVEAKPEAFRLLRLLDDAKYDAIVG